MVRIPQSVPIGDDQIRAAGEVLARAFVTDPICVYTQPDREARMDQFIWLFTQLARESAVQTAFMLIPVPIDLMAWPYGCLPKPMSQRQRCRSGARWIR
jgi:hypothetical protein